MEKIKEINVDDPDFAIFMAYTLKDKCMYTNCLGGEKCPFRDTVNSCCRIGYPEEWDLSEVHNENSK